MQIDTKSDFGKYQPGPLLKTLLKMGWAMPNFIGQQFAQIVRKVVIKLGIPPLDICVEGLNFRFYLADNASEYKFAFMPWRFDKKERDLIAEQITADSVFVDIGANVGIYTLTSSKNIGKQGRILSFEPNPVTFSRLQYNVQSQTDTHPTVAIKLFNLGISDSAQTLELYLSDDNLGSSSLHAGDGETQQSVRVKCLPLLDVLRQENIEKINVLKIDIEGAEDKALVPFFESAPKALFPQYLIMESSHAGWDVDLFELLKQLGYRIRFSTRMNTVFEYA